MKPGRELDVLVAEKVFGLTLKPLFPDEPRLAWVTIDSYGDDEWVCWEGNQPEYSTDIAAAWLVVEHLAEEPLCDVRVNHWNDNDYKWECRVTDYMKQGECDSCGKSKAYEFTAESHSAPHAIALAALKAKGVVSE